MPDLHALNAITPNLGNSSGTPNPTPASTHNQKSLATAFNKLDITAQRRTSEEIQTKLSSADDSADIFDLLIDKSADPKATAQNIIGFPSEIDTFMSEKATDEQKMDFIDDFICFCNDKGIDWSPLESYMKEWSPSTVMQVLEELR